MKQNVSTTLWYKIFSCIKLKREENVYMYIVKIMKTVLTILCSQTVADPGIYCGGG